MVYKIDKKTNRLRLFNTIQCYFLCNEEKSLFSVLHCHEFVKWLSRLHSATINLAAIMLQYENISHLESDLKQSHGIFDSFHNKKILKLFFS